MLAGAVGALVVLLVVLTPPRPPAPGTVVFMLSSSAGDTLPPTTLKIGSRSLILSGAAPRAPQMGKAAQLSLDAGSYPLQLGGLSIPVHLGVSANQVEPVLLAVADGRVDAGGVYVGSQDLNLGLSELGGRLTALPEFHLTDQDGRPLTNVSLLGRDTVIAAFHTTCRETCPLYTGLLFQLRRNAPQVRLVEVTTDPATDTPASLAEYRRRVAADWMFATGSPDNVAEFWAPFGVSLATGDSHTSALALVDSHGFIRATFAGTPDLGGQLPAALESQLSPAGRQLLAGHGEGWGAPAVIESLRTLARASAQSAEGGRAPDFSLRTPEGREVTLQELRGRPVILNFWYASCPPCQQEMPLLQRAADEHPDVAVLLVDHRDAGRTARNFADARRIRAPVLLDEDGRVAAAYHVTGFPTTVFVRPDGTEEGRHPGALTDTDLAANLVNLAGPLHSVR